jgi:2C-methyl-D-erythritol 2,4-cyclodiphosphate synthase
VTILNLSESRDKLTHNMYKIGNVRLSDAKINKTPYNVTITSSILKMLTISGSKVNIKLHESLNILLISERGSIKKILNILLLRQKELFSGGGELNSKKVS